MDQLQAAVAFTFVLCASPAETAGVPSETVTIPAYREIPHASSIATEATYLAAAADRRFRFERISYVSDGLTVYAYLYGPRSSGEKRPIIVFNRGSWTWPKGFAGELLPMAHRLAEAGYYVIAPMYRGSGGAAGRDEMGGADLDDLMNLEPVLARIPGADPSRVFLYGESRGGMMVYQALREGFPARAAAVVGAFTNLEGMLNSPRGAQAASQIWPDLGSNRASIVTCRSAVEWPTRISAPVLIIHGAADHDVPPSQSLEMAAKLVEAKKPVQLMLIDGEDHVISGNTIARDRWVIEWFRRHR